MLPRFPAIGRSICQVVVRFVGYCCNRAILLLFLVFSHKRVVGWMYTFDFRLAHAHPAPSFQAYSSLCAAVEQSKEPRLLFVACRSGGCREQIKGPKVLGRLSATLHPCGCILVFWWVLFYVSCVRREERVRIGGTLL